LNKAIKSVVQTTIAASILINTAHATEGGGTVVPIGVQTIASGVLQDPGNYLLNYNTWVYANSFPGNDGKNTLPDGDLRVQAHSLRYLHVFDNLKIAGGDTAFEIASAYVTSTLSSPFVNGHDSGIGDTSFGPSIGWHSPTFHQMVSLLAVVPTGSYNAQRAVNVGRNYYALQADYAASWFFARQWELSGMLKFVFNGKNHSDGYKSGVETDLDYALNYHFSNGIFAGAGGYWHNQLSNDTLNGNVVNEDGYRVRDLAIGPQIGWGTQRYGGYVAWQHQIYARNTAKGDLLWLNCFVKF
jgi:hypothetical protein